MHPPHIATLNVGSTSLRLDWFEADGAGYQHSRSEHLRRPLDEARTADMLAQRLGRRGHLVHRVVHGGSRLTRPCGLTAARQRELERWSRVAPLHNPPALAMIDACLEAAIPRRRQWLVFDTSLYHTLPEVARHYALPPALTVDVPPRRYGFHGLAHQSLYSQWRRASGTLESEPRVISLQLGGGCSITARRGDQVLDTSMGFTPLEGLMMSTRSGDVDPGLLLYLLRSGAYTTRQLETLLNRDSGLQGVGGGDMETLLQRRGHNQRARLAVDLFCYRARKTLGAMIAVLGGVDAILFGGGIGEHAPQVRAAILQPLEGLGVHLDPKANRDANAPTQPRAIHRGNGTAIWVIAVDEARQMLEDVLPLPQR